MSFLSLSLGCCVISGFVGYLASVIKSRIDAGITMAEAEQRLRTINASGSNHYLPNADLCLCDSCLTGIGCDADNLQAIEDNEGNIFLVDVKQTEFATSDLPCMVG